MCSKVLEQGSGVMPQQGTCSILEARSWRIGQAADALDKGKGEISAGAVCKDETGYE